MVRRVPLVSVLSGIAPVKKRVPLLKSVPLESIPIENNDVTPMETEGSLTAGQQRFKDKVDELEKRYTIKTKKQKEEKKQTEKQKETIERLAFGSENSEAEKQEKKSSSEGELQENFQLKKHGKRPHRCCVVKENYTT